MAVHIATQCGRNELRQARGGCKAQGGGAVCGGPPLYFCARRPIARAAHTYMYLL